MTPTQQKFVNAFKDTFDVEQACKQSGMTINQYRAWLNRETGTVYSLLTDILERRSVVQEPYTTYACDDDAPC